MKCLDAYWELLNIKKKYERRGGNGLSSPWWIADMIDSLSSIDRKCHPSVS